MMRDIMDTVSGTSPAPASAPASQVDLLAEREFQGSNTSKAPQAVEGHDAMVTVIYPDKDRVVLADDRLSFLLSKATVGRLQQIAMAKRFFRKFNSRYQEAKREAGMGQSLIEHSEAEINNPALPEYIRAEIEQDLERRKPGIRIKINRKMEMKQVL